MKNSQVAGAFASGASSGRNAHLFIDGDTVYSYGHHFPIATRGTYRGRSVVFFTTRGYSPTTGQHKGRVFRALCAAGAVVIESGQRSPDRLRVAAPTVNDCHKTALVVERRRSIDEKRAAKAAIDAEARAGLDWVERPVGGGL